VLVAVRRPPRLEGELQPPGDKSISHRLLILNAVAQGRARVANLAVGADVSSTRTCLEALGVELETDAVHGVGLRGLSPASGPLDCGNSGTTMRLLAGLLAGQRFESTLTGDASLSRRPMDRIVTPLRAMGARAGQSPLRVGGSTDLHGVEHRLPVASAQVKSALLLAGLYASGVTRVVERAPTRDHTERMLSAMGASVDIADETVSVRAASRLRPLSMEVPADVSAASFWLVAVGLLPGSRLRLARVGVNPRRASVLEVLGRMGISVARRPQAEAGVEPVADLEVAGSRDHLRPFDISGVEAAAVIDELPVLAVAAAVLPGRSRICDAGELRVKESDRISAMAEGLRAMGAEVGERADGLEIRGPSRLEGTRVRSRGDHRVAMALGVAGMLAEGTTEIDDAECVAVSYPGFWDDAAKLGAVA
jgi:3-phosphoshikimate 1-carboxyvinyltransferase